MAYKQEDFEARFEKWSQQPDDRRLAFDIDYSRVIHSQSFRRLQSKQQVFAVGEHDFHRTRLTHSLEVSQLALSILRQVGDRITEDIIPSSSLIQTIALTHDFGHPPFGHAGERALNTAMNGFGGFEANGQTLRILTGLESFSQKAGFNLTRRSLLGILKYPANFSKLENRQINDHPPKCYLDTEADIVDWLLEAFSDSDRQNFITTKNSPNQHAKTNSKTLDCSIMELADDIAYATHDLEDAIKLSFLEKEQIENLTDKIDENTDYFVDLAKRYNSNRLTEKSKFLKTDHATLKRHISRLINFFLTNIELEESIVFNHPLMRYSVTIKEDAKKVMEILKDTIYANVVNQNRVRHFEFLGKRMIKELFEAFCQDPLDLLPRSTHTLYKNQETENGKTRVVCDHIAGMTDPYIEKIYSRLFVPGKYTIFENL